MPKKSRVAVELSRFTAKHVSEQLGVGLSAAEKYRDGSRRPQDSVRMAVVKLTGKSLEYLFYDGKEE